MTGVQGGGTAPAHEDPWLADVPAASARLVEAAIDAFAERGYHATTTRDIATRVGMSPAALYVHFPSKIALLAVISRHGHEAAAELVDRTLAEPAVAGDPVAGLRAVVGAFAAWHARHHRMARIVQNELAALPEADRREMVRLRRRIEHRVEEVLRAGATGGVMTVPDVRGVARALLSLGVDVARWYVPGGRDTPESVGALYAELAARMVAPPAPPART